MFKLPIDSYLDIEIHLRGGISRLVLDSLYGSIYLYLTTGIVSTAVRKQVDCVFNRIEESVSSKI